jgi:hypothetical protein
MPTPTLRRLPGFAFEARTPVYDEVLPRMDVAVFAGFAASGPVNVPVPVEDAAAFAAIFGADAPLAWNAELGHTVSAQLGPAVRMFFVNGGRRCWVVRLAGAARTDALPVPGVAAVAVGGAARGRAIEPLRLVARSPGSWADGVALAASLASRRFGVLEGDPAGDEILLAGTGEEGVEEGDLLRLTWRGEGVVRYLGVASVAAEDAGRTGRRGSRLQVRAGESQWFDLARDPLQRTGEARLATGGVFAELEAGTASPPAADERVALLLDLPPRQAPRAGEVIVAVFGADELLLSVGEVRVDTRGGSPPEMGIRVEGRGLWRRWPGDPAPGGVPGVERLRLDLRARLPGDDPGRVAGAARRVAGLALAPGHPRHVEHLPDDDRVHGAKEWPDADVWRDAIAPRFPAAGAGEPRLCIPFGVGTLPEHYLPAQRPEGTALERDGLVPFVPALFADEALADRLSTTLLADAEYLRFLAPLPRSLTGVHAALAVEEATLIAAPDAAQPGWERMEVGAPLPPEPPRVSIRERCVEDDFLDCGAVLGPGPTLAASVHDAELSVDLFWTGSEDAEPFVIEEATSRDWRDAAVVFSGSARSATLAGRRPGDYYYRVRGTGARPTDWSNAAAVRLVPGGGGWRVLRPDEYRDEVLVAAHRLLLRYCAARCDVMAVLALPERYREDDAAAHVRHLAARAAPFIPLRPPMEPPDTAPSAGRPPVLVPPLGTGEQDALGFAALYHGWLYTRDIDGRIRTAAPDGAACGVIARRANARGAWVAPANETLRGVVALVRPAPPSQWQNLQQLQLNVVRQHPRGFIVLNADTLASDDEVRPINVRRLLILLRRLATRLGATYVFEPNDDSFRRMVQRGFEAMLTSMFQRGAFAGATAASAFQVVTGERLNTPRQVDQGRFIVELRVAPSRPMAFLTLRLVQTGERIAVTGA